ncbi:MAG: ABC transporter permease, partial [Candidatus Solibacter usitatus]|nr:ABC transporter permease [Candidatus Solibacter usitatus]
MDALIRDFIYAARSLGRDKGFAVTVALTLAVSIGANTATFAIVHSILLRPLPVPEASAILLMSNQYPKAGVGESSFSGAGDYYDRLRDVPAFQQQAMFNFANQTVEINGTPEQVTGMAATPSLFRLLRVAAAHGRTFTEEEGEIGAERKIILSYGLWRQLYGGSTSALGRDLRLGGRPFTIVGVMPPGFVFINPEVRLWAPLAFLPAQKSSHHSNNWYNIGRLKPGATLQQAQAQIDALNAANLERSPQWKEILTNAGFHTRVEPLQDQLVKDVKGVLYLLWGGAVFVLLIGGLNIANLALARLTLRRKELATRLALGAGRAQLTRQLAVENLLLAVTGGAAGVALGAALLRALAAGLGRLPRAHEVRIDGVVALVVLGLALVTGILAGLIPLAQVFKASLSNVLHEDSRTGTSGSRARRVRQGLVVAQFALAFVLLAGAGLLLASFRQLLQVDPGYRTGGVLTASINAPRSKYPGPGELRTLMNRSLEALRRIPGARSAGATTVIPLGGDRSDSVILAEGYVMRPGESLISPRQATVTPGYFETLGIALLRGRYFDDRDRENAPFAVIVDERLARRFWPDRDPIGRRMYQPQDVNDLMKIDARTRWLRVVGVVRSVRSDDLAGTG